MDQVEEIEQSWYFQLPKRDTLVHGKARVTTFKCRRMTSSSGDRKQIQATKMVTRTTTAQNAEHTRKQRQRKQETGLLLDRGLSVKQSYKKHTSLIGYLPEMWCEFPNNQEHWQTSFVSLFKLHTIAMECTFC